MGYPMTYVRVLNRNRLCDGQYDITPAEWSDPGGAVAWSVVEGMGKDEVAKLLRDVIESQNEQAERRNGKLRALAGDLRRLEADTKDEGAVCQIIANRTGIDPESVAAVLNAWMEV